MTLVPFASAGAVRTGKRIIGGLDNAPTGAGDDLVCSFDGDTEVLMADGTTKPISEIEVGDEVLATDPETGETNSRTVTDTHIMLHDGDLLDVSVEDNDSFGVIYTTDRHKFWSITDHAWVPAIELDEGDQLRQADGTTATVMDVDERDGREDMWDLTVAVDHTFYVSTSHFEGDPSALVHNCIRNQHLAGHTHPTTGVPFDAAGFPDFSTWRHPSVSDVRIQPSGSRATDATRANQAAGLSRTPEGYVWHHHQDSGLMQLIEKDVHQATGHTGGFSRGG